MRGLDPEHPGSLAACQASPPALQASGARHAATAICGSAVELAGPEGTADASREQLLATEDTDEACTFVRERIYADLKFSRTEDGKIH